MFWTNLFLTAAVVLLILWGLPTPPTAGTFRRTVTFPRLRLEGQFIDTRPAVLVALSALMSAVITSVVACSVPGGIVWILVLGAVIVSA